MKKTIIGIFIFVLMFVATAKFAPKMYAAITDESFDVEVVVVYGDGQQANANMNSRSHGSNVSLDVSAFGDDFVYFIANGEVIENENHQFRVTSDLYIVAVVKDENQLVSVFLDSNGQFIDADYVLSGQTPVAPDVSNYSKPGYVIDTVNPWSPAISALADNEIYELNYALDSSASFSVTVNEGVISNASPTFNEVVTVSAPESASAGYWTENDHIVYYGLSYSFTALSNRDLVYVESGDAEAAVVSLIDVSGIRSGYDSYLGQVSLPDGSELVEYGFLLNEGATTEALDLSNAGSVVASSSLNSNLEFLRSVSVDTAASVRAYAIIDDGSGILETIYSAYQIGTSGSEVTYASDLFISEYIEGSSSNKALEIFNGTGEDIDLSDYKVETYSNGSSSANYNIELSGILAHGDVYVIYNSSAVAGISSQGDVASSITYFNGDDAVALLKNSVVIDVIGEIGVDPGTNWAAGDGSTLNHTIVRNANVSNPVTSYDSTQWISYDEDDFNYIGSHTFNGAPAVELTDMNKANAAFDDLSLAETLELSDNYDLPSSGLYDAVISWSSDNQSVITDGGIISRPTFGQGNATANLSYVIEVGLASIEGTIAVTVLEMNEEFTITYNPNDGVLTDISSVTVESGSLLEEPSAPTRDGYSFIGWFDASSDGNEWDFDANQVTSSFTLYAQWINEGSVAPTYVETFDNFSYTGGSYSSGSFVGINSITWNYTSARGDFDLDGRAIMLKGNGTFISSVISGGISYISINYYDAYSGAAEFEIYINDVLVGTSPSFDGDSDNTPQLYEIENINITGDFTIKIVSSDSQAVLDNITFVNYSE